MSGERPGSSTDDREWPGGPPGEGSHAHLARPRRDSRLDPEFLLARSWAIFSVSWPACLVVYWGTVAAWWLIINLLVIVLASMNLAVGDPALTPFLEFLRFLGIFLVPTWLWLGQCIAFLKIARRQPVAQQDLFRGGPYLLTALLAIVTFLAITGIACLVVYGLIEALLAIAGINPPVPTFWQLLNARAAADVATLESHWLFLLGISMAAFSLWYAAFFAVRVRLRVFPFLIIDRRAGVTESIRTAFRLTRRNVATLFVVHLAQLTINLAGLLVCCAGLFVTLPLTSLISAVTYDGLAADLPPLEPLPDDAEGDEPD